MKTIILSVAIIAAIVFSCCFYSCNKNEDAITNTETPEVNNDLKLLADQLESYNNDFSKENEDLFVETRGHNIFWWGCLVLADYSGAEAGGALGGIGGPHGAIAGALIGGIGGSVCFALARIEMPTNNPINNQINTQIYPIDNDYNYIGQAHNEILAEMSQNKAKYVTNGIINYDLVMNDIFSKVQKYGVTSSEISLFRSKKIPLINECKETIAMINPNVDLAISINRVFDRISSKYACNKEEMAITKDYILNATKISDLQTLAKYATGYEKVIMQSNVTPEVKKDLLSTISVGKSSQAYWCSQSNQDGTLINN